jgi:hypothetical protein
MFADCWRLRRGWSDDARLRRVPGLSCSFGRTQCRAGESYIAYMKIAAYNLWKIPKTNHNVTSYWRMLFRHPVIIVISFRCSVADLGERRVKLR